MKNILLLFSITAATIVLARPVKSGLGADGVKGIEDISWTPTASDYVQEGLVALWDGEWNGGVGLHLDSTFEWVDLTGNQPPLVPVDSETPLAFGDSYVVGSANIPKNEVSGALFSSTKTYTIEVVFVDVRMAYDGAIFSTGMMGYSYGTGLGAATWQRNHSNSPMFITVGNSSVSIGTTSTGEAQSFSLSFDGSAIAYKNGSILGTCQVGTRTTDRLTLGLSRSDYSATDYGYSRLYVFRIYDRALTEEEIFYNHEIDKARFDLP